MLIAGPTLANVSSKLAKLCDTVNRAVGVMESDEFSEYYENKEMSKHDKKSKVGKGKGGAKGGKAGTKVGKSAAPAKKMSNAKKSINSKDKEKAKENDKAEGGAIVSATGLAATAPIPEGSVVEGPAAEGKTDDITGQETVAVSESEVIHHVFLNHKIYVLPLFNPFTCSLTNLNPNLL